MRSSRNHWFAFRLDGLVATDIKPLREPRSIGRALAHSEKIKLLALAGRVITIISLAYCTRAFMRRGREAKGLN